MSRRDADAPRGGWQAAARQREEFARAFSALPPARQLQLVREFRNALRVVRDADSELTHQPYGSPDRGFTHRHPHHVSGDQTHDHQHTHFGDAAHIGHDHEDLDAAAASAERAKRQRRAGAAMGRIMNQARPVDPVQQRRIDAAWARAAAAIEQPRKDQR